MTYSAVRLAFRSRASLVQRCGARWLTGLVLMWGPVAAAQTEAPPAEAETDAADALQPPAGATASYTVELTAGVWIPRLNGDSRLGEGFGVADISLEDDLDLDGSETIFNAELTVRFLDKWMARASGYQFSTDDSGTFSGDVRFGSLTLLPGDAYRSTFDLDSYAAEAGYVVWHPLGDATADLRVMAAGGLRYLEVEHTIESPGFPRAKGEGDWIVLYGGADLSLQVRPPSGFIAGRALGIDVGVGMGLDVNEDHGFYGQIRGGVTLEVVRNVSFNIGYRYLHADFTDGDYEFSGGLSGLFVGATVRF